MNNFFPKLEDATSDQLKHWTNETSPHLGTLASDELTRRALNNLEQTIKTFNEQSSIQTKKLIRLTWWIVGLTIVMVVGLITQIILSI
jgi:hypothetical protein